MLVVYIGLVGTEDAFIECACDVPTLFLLYTMLFISCIVL